MIILRKCSKLFMAREDNWKLIPPEQRFDHNHPLAKKHGRKIEVFEKTKPENNYNKQSNSLPKELIKIQRPKIESLKKSIKAGYLYEDREVGENTHPYNKKCDLKKHVLTKDINDQDRLGYEVYPPEEINKDPNVPVRVGYRLIHRKGHLEN